MLLLRSSRLALARSRAFSSGANRSQPVVTVAVASSPSRKAEECCAKDERGSKKRPASSSVLISANKQSAASSVAASALGGSSTSSSSSLGGGETLSPPDRRTSEALVAALQQQQPESRSSSSSSSSSKAPSSSPPEAGGGAEQSKSEIQALAARLWSAYDAALTSHPVAVKSATSFVGFLLGDLIAQSIVGLPYDARRTLRLVSFGVLMDGPIGHLWYTTLDRNVFPEDPTSTKAVVAKTALDQLLWAPAFSCVFFAFVNLFEGRPDLIGPAIAAKLLPMLAANYALWPLAHLINFKFVPSKQRILYINCVQVVWSAYLSHLSAGAIRAAGHF